MQKAFLFLLLEETTATNRTEEKGGKCRNFVKVFTPEKGLGKEGAYITWGSSTWGAI